MAALAKKLGLAGGDEAPLAFLVFPSSTLAAPRSSTPTEEIAASGIFAGHPNELSTEEVRYEALLDIHRSTLLPEPAGPPPSVGAPIVPDSIPSAPDSSNVLEPATAEVGLPADSFACEISRPPVRDAPFALIARQRRSALDFDPQTALMERTDLEQLLDFATRDWPSDWRGNFPGLPGRREDGADLITLYLYVHRVRDCEPGIYRWNKPAARPAAGTSPASAHPR